MKSTLKIHFGNDEVARHFASWLCGHGEQSYWAWMEYREREEEGNITATKFEYTHPQNEEFPRNDKRRYENAVFVNNLEIFTETGRISEEN